MQEAVARSGGERNEPRPATARCSDAAAATGRMLSKSMVLQCGRNARSAHRRAGQAVPARDMLAGVTGAAGARTCSTCSADMRASTLIGTTRGASLAAGGVAGAAAAAPVSA